MSIFFYKKSAFFGKKEPLLKAIVQTCQPYKVKNLEILAKKT